MGLLLRLAPYIYMRFALIIGSLLQVLRLAVDARIDHVLFMGLLGQGSWHEWAYHPLDGLRPISSLLAPPPPASSTPRIPEPFV